MNEKEQKDSKEKEAENEDNSFKNIKNPDFLWEIPQNDTRQRIVREVQEVN
jgi:hypothetical protein